MGELVRAKRGRPAREIDQRLFENACRLMCTEKELKFLLGVGSDHLYKWVRETYNNQTLGEVMDHFSAEGKMSVRRNLFRLSERNAQACIFLAKNWLGMRESFEIENNTPIEPLKIEVTGVDNAERIKMIEASITKPDENSKTV